MVPAPRAWTRLSNFLACSLFTFPGHLGRANKSTVELLVSGCFLPYSTFYLYPQAASKDTFWVVFFFFFQCYSCGVATGGQIFTFGTTMNHIRMRSNHAWITGMEALASVTASIISSNFQAISKKKKKNLCIFVTDGSDKQQLVPLTQMQPFTCLIILSFFSPRQWAVISWDKLFPIHLR